MPAEEKERKPARHGLQQGNKRIENILLSGL
jgi:hypothetical protein